MESQHKQIPLTASEVGFLWEGYRCETIFFWSFKYFEKVTEDMDILKDIHSALDIFSKHIQVMKKKFSEAGIPIPVGTTEHDINLNAPKLFTDQTVLFFLKDTAITRLEYYAKNIKNSSRQDIRELSTNFLTDYVTLEHQVTDSLLNKGMYVRPPQIPIPETIDYVKKESYLTGWFGERRPVHAMQISQLFLNIQRNTLAKTLLMGFNQTVGSDKVKKYIEKGKIMTSEVIDSLKLFLSDVNIDVAIPSGLGITTSTKAPFSDKLVLDILVNITRCAIEDYGLALASSTRRDLFVFYEKTITGTTTYANDNIQLQIDYGYLEEMPKATDYNELAKNPHN